MDNITHSLTGLALARSGLHRFSPHATALLVISANIPDADFAYVVRGSLRYFEVHRGYSHSALLLPLTALLPVLLVAAFFCRPLPWRNAWLLSSIGVASHLLLDWTNSYGIRLLLPVSSQWFYLDLNGLYDIVILAVLLFAAIWPLFSQLVSGEIGGRSSAGQALALFALAFFVLFDGGRAVMHSRAVAQLESRLYDDAPPIRAAALPDPFNPFRWRGVVETERGYQVSELNAWSASGLEASATYFKPAVTRWYRSAKATEPFARSA